MPGVDGWFPGGREPVPSDSAVVSEALLRPFLALVAFFAGSRIVAALGSGLIEAPSAGHALIAFLGLPTLLIAVTATVALSRRRRRAAMIVAARILALSVLAGALALVELTFARAHGMPMDAALLEVVFLRDAAGLGLCVGGLAWGIASAGNILARDPEPSEASPEAR